MQHLKKSISLCWYRITNLVPLFKCLDCYNYSIEPWLTRWYGKKRTRQKHINRSQCVLQILSDLLKYARALILFRYARAYIIFNYFVKIIMTYLYFKFIWPDIWFEMMSMANSPSRSHSVEITWQIEPNVAFLICITRRWFLDQKFSSAKHS